MFYFRWKGDESRSEYDYVDIIIIILKYNAYETWNKD